MQYLLMIYSKEGAWEKMSPAEQQQGLAAYNAFTEALKKSGALAGRNRLRGVSTATTAASRRVSAPPRTTPSRRSRRVASSTT